MNVFTVSEIQDRLQQVNLSQVTRETGINRYTLHMIKSGKDKDYLFSTIVTLSNYFGADDADRA